jgi:hypothetical protein
MNKFKSFLIKFPIFPLAIMSLMLGMAPFVPEPHLLEKLKMLMAGDLVKPIDIFDLIMHATPVTLLVLKLTWAKEE